LEIVCFSEYSDISNLIIASSSSNNSFAKALTNSVLPTPVGPTKTNDDGFLIFLNPDLFLLIALATPSYQSVQEIMETEAMVSDAIDVPYDDHLSEIKIPVYYVGAGGGEGQYGKYILNLIGSTDKNSMIVQLYPSQYAVLDYGHADPLWADNAETLVWSPILNWISSR
jgi:hypothetical protein